jgi:hypothetical protein
MTDGWIGATKFVCCRECPGSTSSRQGRLEVDLVACSPPPRDEAGSSLPSKALWEKKKATSSRFRTIWTVSDASPTGSSSRSTGSPLSIEPRPWRVSDGSQQPAHRDTNLKW